MYFQVACCILLVAALAPAEVTPAPSVSSIAITNLKQNGGKGSDDAENNCAVGNMYKDGTKGTTSEETSGYGCRITVEKKKGACLQNVQITIAALIYDEKKGCSWSRGAVACACTGDYCNKKLSQIYGMFKRRLDSSTSFSDGEEDTLSCALEVLRVVFSYPPTTTTTTTTTMTTTTPAPTTTKSVLTSSPTSTPSDKTVDGQTPAGQHGQQNVNTTVPSDTLKDEMSGVLAWSLAVCGIVCFLLGLGIGLLLLCFVIKRNKSKKPSKNEQSTRKETKELKPKVPSKEGESKTKEDDSKEATKIADTGSVTASDKKTTIPVSAEDLKFEATVDKTETMHTDLASLDEMSITRSWIRRFKRS